MLISEILAMAEEFGMTGARTTPKGLRLYFESHLQVDRFTYWCDQEDLPVGFEGGIGIRHTTMII